MESLRLYANPTGRVEVENVFEIHFAVHTIFTKIWERPLLAKSTLKQVKKISKWSKKPTYYISCWICHR
jgi:hypothetical protein